MKFDRIAHSNIMMFAAPLAAMALAIPLSQPAAAQRKSALKVVDKVLTTGDNVGIAITYYQSNLGKDAPVVIMLPMKGSNRLVWKTNGLAKQLQRFGYAVITVDLRKHGESVVGGMTTTSGRKKAAELGVADYRAMVGYDMQAVKDFILSEHHAKRLNIRKTAIIAPEMSAPVAAVFALADWLRKPYPDSPTVATSTPRGQDIRALVFLSPSESAPGLNAVAAYRSLGAPLFNVAVLVGYGKGDVVDRGGKKAQAIFRRISGYPGAKKRMYLKAYSSRLRGTDLLGRKLPVEANIINFLNMHLKKLPDAWRDRHSKLN